MIRDNLVGVYVLGHPVVNSPRGYPQHSLKINCLIQSD